MKKWIIWIYFSIEIALILVDFVFCVEIALILCLFCILRWNCVDFILFCIVLKSCWFFCLWLRWKIAWILCWNHRSRCVDLWKKICWICVHCLNPDESSVLIFCWILKSVEFLYWNCVDSFVLLMLYFVSTNVNIGSASAMTYQQNLQ